MPKLKLTDKIKAVNSVLFIIFGIIIMIRSINLIFLSTGLRALMPILVGASFVGYGIYRTVYVIKYLRDKQ